MLHTSLIVKLLIKEVRGMSQYYLVPSSELYHHGVLGMKWGHRKERTSGNSIIRTAGASHYDRKIQRTNNRIKKQKAEIKKHSEKMNFQKQKLATQQQKYKKKYSDISKQEITRYRKATKAIMRTAGMVGLGIMGRQYALMEAGSASLHAFMEGLNMGTTLR